MFLKKTGEVVKDFDVWKAFRKASERLGKRIVPHMLRHTFATWVVMVWAEKEGIGPTSESFYKHIHDMLAEQLGHKRISTTKKYCRTASFLAFGKLMPKVTEKALGKPHVKRAFLSLKAHGFDTGL
jgi:integrase